MRIFKYYIVFLLAIAVPFFLPDIYYALDSRMHLLPTIIYGCLVGFAVYRTNIDEEVNPNDTAEMTICCTLAAIIIGTISSMGKYEDVSIDATNITLENGTRVELEKDAGPISITVRENDIRDAVFKDIIQGLKKKNKE